MPAYVRKSTVEDQYEARRMPGGVIQCGHCGRNLANTTDNPEGTLFLVYIDKKHLNEERPHDVYCGDCRASFFGKAISV